MVARSAFSAGSAGEHRTGVLQQLPSFVKRARVCNVALRKVDFAEHPPQARRFF
jgi:hypothetical protein